MENEDAFQHIDDDMLAQVIYEASIKVNCKRVEVSSHFDALRKYPFGFRQQKIYRKALEADL